MIIDYTQKDRKTNNHLRLKHFLFKFWKEKKRHWTHLYQLIIISNSSCVETEEDTEKNNNNEKRYMVRVEIT